MNKNIIKSALWKSSLIISAFLMLGLAAVSKSSAQSYGDGGDNSNNQGYYSPDYNGDHRSGSGYDGNNMPMIPKPYRDYQGGNDNYYGPSQDQSQGQYHFKNRMLERLDQDSQFRQDFIDRLKNDDNFRGQMMDRMHSEGMMGRMFADRFENDSNFRNRMLDKFMNDDNFRHTMLRRMDEGNGNMMNGNSNGGMMGGGMMNGGYYQ